MKRLCLKGLDTRDAKLGSMKRPCLKGLDTRDKLVQASEFTCSVFWMEWKSTKQENKLNGGLTF